MQQKLKKWLTKDRCLLHLMIYHQLIESTQVKNTPKLLNNNATNPYIEECISNIYYLGINEV